MAGEKILVIDDEESICEFLSLLLRKEGYLVTATTNGEEAIGLARETNFDTVVTDIKMPGVDGLDVLSNLKEIDPGLPVIIMTAFPSQESAIEAVNRGAFQYLEKNAGNDEIRIVVKNALEMRKVQSENLYLKRQLKKSHESKDIIRGTSEEMARIFKTLEKVADTDSTILIYGESGTGKELIAKEIHYKSHRAHGPFVSINCGALPKDLLESNLFGHVKGSFTGAVKDQVGLFAVADGGSFFLDEVGETLPATQVKLLRVLQEREIIPVGGIKPIRVNVRLIAATNADLDRLVQEGKFRADLFYRLNVIPVRLPALRQRREDIPLLADHFLRRFSGDAEPKKISRDAMDVMKRYDWPGNVRELENVLERAVILDEDGSIDKNDLPERVLEGPGRRGSLVIDCPTMTLGELEKEYILKVLNYTRWHKKRAAEVLGINASTLYRKLQAYGMLKGVPAEDDEEGQIAA
jgi:two-component system response regulator PilR (NtrC family)